MANEHLQDGNHWFLHCPHCGLILDESKCEVLGFNQIGRTDTKDSSIKWMNKIFKVRCTNDPLKGFKQPTVDRLNSPEEKDMKPIG